MSYDSFLLLLYAETKEMIYESVNLKEVVYKPKQTVSAFSLSPHVQVFKRWSYLYKVHSLSSEQVFN